MSTAAVFFDRDDTLIEDPGFVSHPDQVRLFDDGPAAIARLARAGYRIVVVSNQSGIARGLFTEDDLAAVHRRLQKLLNDRGAWLDAIYSCPYLDGPEATIAAYRRPSDLRKPAPGMLLQAAGDLQIDLGRSWMIGNSARDIEAGRRAGCRTVLLEHNGPDDAGRQAEPTRVASSLQEAADIVLQEDVQPTSSDKPQAPPDERESAPDAGEPTSEQREPASSDQGPTTDDQPASPPPRQATDAELLTVLGEIRELLDRSHRTRRQQDFSLLRLSGALLQMVAVVAGVWGLFVLASDAAAATARFALAAFLQVAALTIMLSDRRE